MELKVRSGPALPLRQGTCETSSFAKTDWGQ
jgi:hypothetical protein